MDVFKAIEKRRSVRKYLEIPVEMDKIGLILEAGRLAPSAGNVQEWVFFVVTDDDKRKQIAESALSQHWMEIAPVHIIIAANIEKIKRHYGMRGERLYAIQDCSVAASFMMLAAQELGLSSCWVGAFDEGKVQRIIKMPDDIRPQLILTLGYGDEKPEMPMRYPLENLVFFETYGGVGRIKDIERVLWDHNVVGRAVKTTKDAAGDVEKHTRKDREELFEKLKRSCGKISEKLAKKKEHKQQSHKGQPKV